MKKLLLSIIALVTCFAVGFAQDEKLVTFDFLTNDYGYDRGANTYLDGESCVESPVTFTMVRGTGSGHRFWSDGLRFYKGTGFELTVPDGCKITQIDFAGTATFKEEGDTKNSYSKTNSWVSTEGVQTVKFNLSATNTKALEKLTVHYIGESTEPLPSVQYRVTYKGNHGTLKYYDVVGMSEVAEDGVKFDEGSNVTFNLVADDGYNLKRATVNGEDATEQFAAGDYTLTIDQNYVIAAVFAPQLPENTVFFDFESESYGNPRGDNEPYLESGVTLVEEPVTITLSKNEESTTGMRFRSDGLRLFKNSGAAMTFSVPEGKVIKSIKFVSAASLALRDGEPGEFVDKVWTGEAQLVTFDYTGTNNASVQNVTVEYGDAVVPPTEYTVTYSGEHGTLKYYDIIGMSEVTAEGVKFEEGSNVTFKLTPDEGYVLKQVTANDADLTADFADGEHTMTIDRDYAIAAVFEPEPVIEPKSGSVLVPAGSLTEGSQVYSFRFDDAPLGQHTNGTNTATSDLRSRNLTYSAWVNLRDVKNDQAVMGNIQSAFAGATAAFRVGYKDGKIYLAGRDAAGIGGGFNNKDGVAVEGADASVATDEWVFLSVVADQEAKTVTLYKNCRPIASFATNYGVGILTDPASFYVSDYGASIAVSEVQLWTKALTQDELMDTYNYRPETIPAELVAYYKSTEFVDGSSTELRNLGSEGVTPAKVIMGTYHYDYSAWSPYLENQEDQVIDLIDDMPVIKKIAVTLTQPDPEGCSFKLVGLDGTEIEGEAEMFQPLNVVADLPAGVNVTGVKVHEVNTGADHVYTLAQLPFRPADDINVSILLDDKFTVKATVEDGTAVAVINDGEETAIPADGLAIAKGSKVVIKLRAAGDGYELKSFTVDGEDCMADLVDNAYIIDDLQKDYVITAAFTKPMYHLTIENPTEPRDQSYYGEFRDNMNQRFDYDDADGHYVDGVTSVIFFIIPPQVSGAKLTSVTDNGKEVALTEFNGGYICMLGKVHEDHHFVVTQEPLAAIGEIGDDTEGITVADGMIIASDNATVEVFDLSGRSLLRGHGTLDISRLAAGTYVARAIADGKSVTVKFVKF